MGDLNPDIQDWNRIAKDYSDMAGTADDFIYQQFKPVLWDSLGDLNGLAVLDLGCGHGWLSNAMAEAGGQMQGIDGSAQLLAQARSAYPHIDFAEWDLLDGIPETYGKFNRIVANMVLMDIPELGPLLASVRRHLADRGRFIFTMQHPSFFQQKSQQDPETGEWYCKVTGYHREEVWRIESFGGHNHYHRSLTYYFDRLRENRLAVTRLYEPPHVTQADSPGALFLRTLSKFILIEAQAMPG